MHIYISRLLQHSRQLRHRPRMHPPQRNLQRIPRVTMKDDMRQARYNKALKKLLED